MSLPKLHGAPPSALQKLLRMSLPLLSLHPRDRDTAEGGGGTHTPSSPTSPHQPSKTEKVWSHAGGCGSVMPKPVYSLRMMSMARGGFSIQLGCIVGLDSLFMLAAVGRLLSLVPVKCQSLWLLPSAERRSVRKTESPHSPLQRSKARLQTFRRGDICTPKHLLRSLGPAPLSRCHRTMSRLQKSPHPG